MKDRNVKLVLTGFMGVGKSSVARHLSHRLRCKWTDLDRAIEDREQRLVAAVIDDVGIGRYREIESEVLADVVTRPETSVLSLGGGAWTLEKNRDKLREHGFESVWLEATFEHCWLNITFSKKERPLARDKQKARKLFDERQSIYCLADWHFVVRSDQTSYDVARNIAEEVFG